MVVSTDTTTELSNAEIDKEIAKKQRNLLVVTAEYVANCKKLFDLFGIPYTVAPGEAENLCAIMCHHDIVHGCMLHIKVSGPGESGESGAGGGGGGGGRGGFKPQDLANTAWAFATVGRSDAALFAFLARGVERLL